MNKCASQVGSSSPRTEVLKNRTHLLLSPWLSAPGLYLIHGYFNTGKTLLALGISFAVASGEGFLKWSAGSPGRVLFVDNEWGTHNLQIQVRAVLADINVEDKLPIEFISPDLPYGVSGHAKL